MKSKELIKAEIVSQLQQQSMAVLLDTLTEAMPRLPSWSKSWLN